MAKARRDQYAKSRRAFDDEIETNDYRFAIRGRDKSVGKSNRDHRRDRRAEKSCYDNDSSYEAYD